MPTIIPFGLSPSPYPNLLSTTPSNSPHFLKSRTILSPLKSGICKASQTVELFPQVCPEIVVREARIEDCWEVAETHCSSFFPDYTFPLDLALRIDRLVGMLSGFSLPNGCMRTCLVAVVGNNNNTAVFGSDLDGNFGWSKGYVAGILTVDTVADFLPRKGPLRQRRCVHFFFFFFNYVDAFICCQQFHGGIFIAIVKVVAKGHDENVCEKEDDEDKGIEAKLDLECSDELFDEDKEEGAEWVEYKLMDGRIGGLGAG
ncbi:hypothetical protein IFM89_038799 [Coptis chinensis]|uniref:Uncharacterized protein n=1 Tax=Coptis chinensis TaxID=261450 RepID=A0A835HMB9_9MAGN|nr:hypothetical protein IFM89_038799 [Coptis chinensis]